MKLTVSQRTGKKKSDIKSIRREGNVPAILYSPNHEPETLTIDGSEFAAVLREMKPGHLATTIFVLVQGNKERKAIVKDIQYNLPNYNVTHLDFEELSDKVPVSVKVPVSFTGVMDCVGIKLGGFLRQVSRFVKVQCLPKNIPSEFQIDVKDLGIRQSKRLSDLSMPAGVKPLARTDEVIVVIAKQRG